MATKVVDLSMEVYERMPVYPIHQKTFSFINQTHEESSQATGAELGFEAHNWLLSEHTGTHSDAVYEYKPGSDTIEDMSLESFYGSAICLDVSQVRYPDWITIDSIKRSLNESDLSIDEGDIVLLRTGHYERTFEGNVHSNSEYVEDSTGLTKEATKWLAQKGVVNIGIDTPSIDHFDDEEFVGHKICGEHEITNTENLVNLGKVAGKRFTYHGLPIKFREGTGSPIRAVAFIEDQ